MRVAKTMVLLIALAAIVVAGERGADAKTARARQYYTSWRYHGDRGYHYRTYYYLPTEDDTEYQYHYVTYYPSRPRYYYYYNPRSRRYWGRFDTEGQGESKYSLLADKDRKEDLKEIDESAFPAPAAMPPIPESKDGVKIEPPPLDAPKDGKSK